MTEFLKTASIGAAIALILGSPSAWATFTTETAQVQTTTGGATVPRVITVNGISAAGDSFSNSISSNAVGTEDADVRVVGANLLSSYGQTPAGFENATFDGDSIVAVYAFQGNTTNGPGGASVYNATSGAIGFFTITGGFNQYDPTTWGATSGGGLATPLAVYTLSPPDDILTGTGSSLFTPVQASGVNKSAINVLNSQSTQGYFVFEEDNAAVSPVAPAPGVTYIEITDPPGVPADGEGLALQNSSSFDFGPGDDTAAMVATLSAGLPELNIIGQVLGGYTALAGGGYFASQVCLATNAACFADNDAFAVATTFLNSGDFAESTGLVLVPTAKVPEPASLALLGLGLAGLGASARRRKRA